MSAWIDILRTSLSRRAIRSSVVITAPAMSRAMVLLTMLVRIIFARIDPPPNDPTRLSPLATRGPDDPAELHELGADLDSRALHRFRVDVETHLLVLHPERDLPAAGGELIDVADRQDRGALQAFENRGQPVPL